MHRENKLYINQSQILFKVASKENIFKGILTVNVSKICITRFSMHFMFNGLRCQRRFFFVVVDTKSIGMFDHHRLNKLSFRYN